MLVIVGAILISGCSILIASIILVVLAMRRSTYYVTPKVILIENKMRSQSET